MECQTLWDYFVNEVLDGVRNLGEPTPETTRTMRQWSRASLTNVLEASRTWHNTANERYQNKRLAEAAKNAVRAEQEGLYQPQHRNYEVGKVKFEFLSFKELPAEGKMMHHCVGSYIHDAAARRTFIFHGNLDGEQATIEISVDLRVRQLFGPCNQECSDSMKQAARNLCAVLEKEHRNHEG